MSAAMCPDCGARNAERAPWCTQCYRPLGAVHEPAAERSREHDTGRASAPSAPALADSTTPDLAPPRPTTHDARDVRQGDHGQVEWRCASCAGWSLLAAPTCATCGAPRRGFGEPPPTGPLDESRLLLLTGLLPGLGHLQAGRIGSGIVRAVFAVGWLLGGVLLLVAATRAGSGIWPAVPLLVGAAIVWAWSIRDVQALARGVQREHLDGRTLLWLMVGVTSLLVVALLFDAWRLAS